jgi:hypothetical protein
MKVRNVLNYVQAHLIVGANFLVSSEVPTAVQYIRCVAIHIERNPGELLPLTNGASQTSVPLEPSEEAQERFALIAHIVNCRSLLRIHVLEKKIKTVHADVISDLPVRIVQIHIQFHHFLLPCSQGPVAQGVLDVLNGVPNGPLASLDSFFSVEFWVRSPFSSFGSSLFCVVCRKQTNHPLRPTP